MAPYNSERPFHSRNISTQMVHPLTVLDNALAPTLICFAARTWSLRFPAEMSAATDWWTRVLRKGCLAVLLAACTRVTIVTHKPTDMTCDFLPLNQPRVGVHNQGRKSSVRSCNSGYLTVCWVKVRYFRELRNVPYDHTFLSRKSGWRIRSLCYWDVKV